MKTGGDANRAREGSKLPAKSAPPSRPVGLRPCGSKVWYEMWTWIVIVLLYVLEIALFRVLGGTGAAGDALRRWGRSSSGGRYLGSRSS